MKAALGLDVGTTSVKAVVVDEHGQFVGAGTSGVLRMRSPEPGWAVQSTSDLHTAVVDCLTATAESLPHDVEVLSLTMAAQSGSLVTADRAGNVADDTTTWMDTRSRSIVERWHDDHTADIIRAHSGWSAHPGQGLPQLSWLRESDSKSWASVGHVAAADDLVMYWLTGAWVTNPSNAAGMALIDLTTGQWSPTLREIAGVELSQLSEIRRSGDVLGPLTPEAADATGLGSKLVVINGGHDQACAALALGVTAPARALLAGGTAWVLTTVISDTADGVSGDVPAGMNISFHVVPHLRTASIYLGGMGASIEWWLNASKLQGSGPDRHAAFNHEISAMTTTAASPYFRPLEDAAGTHPGAGEFVATNARTTDLDRALSIMEYAAFTLNTALLSIPVDLRPTLLNVAGGVTQSPVWSQLIADICGVAVVRSAETSLPAVGAAVLGGVATGVFASTEKALSTLDLSSEHVYPNVHNAELHRHRYSTHLEQESKP